MSHYIIHPDTEIDTEILKAWWKKPTIDTTSESIVLLTDKVHSRFSGVFFLYPSHMKAIRTASDLTRWEFCVANVEKNASFNPNSLASWELWRRTPREEIHRIYAEIAEKMWFILQMNNNN